MCLDIGLSKIMFRKNKVWQLKKQLYIIIKKTAFCCLDVIIAIVFLGTAIPRPSMAKTFNMREGGSVILAGPHLIAFSISPSNWGLSHFHSEKWCSSKFWLHGMITVRSNTLFSIFEYMTIAVGSSKILTGYFSQFKITLKSREKTATVERLQVLRWSTTFFPIK